MLGSYAVGIGSTIGWLRSHAAVLLHGLELHVLQLTLGGAHWSTVDGNSLYGTSCILVPPAGPP